MELSGKVAIVTGGGSGIGRSIALALSSEGAKVVVNDVNEQNATAVCREITAKGREALEVTADVRSGNEVSRMVETALVKFGKIDILCNNAGVSLCKRLMDYTEEDYDIIIMDVNMKGVYLCTVAVVRHMIRQGIGGRIVNIASVLGKTGDKYYTIYSASKHAVVGWTRSIHYELAPYKINVNAVCPGPVATPLLERDIRTCAGLDGIGEEEMKRNWLSFIPLGRFAEPYDVAKIVVLLCSSQSDYVTGQSINVSGGWDSLITFRSRLCVC